MSMNYAELIKPETLIDLSQVELLLKAHGVDYSVDYANPWGLGEKHVFDDEGQLMFSPNKLGQFYASEVMEKIEG